MKISEQLENLKTELFNLATEGNNILQSYRSPKEAMDKFTEIQRKTLEIIVLIDELERKGE